MEVKIFRGIRN